MWNRTRAFVSLRCAFEARRQSAYLGAVLFGLRTSDPGKQIRLGTLTINCDYANDLKPESLDGMMQATTELKEEGCCGLGGLSTTK